MHQHQDAVWGMFHKVYRGQIKDLVFFVIKCQLAATNGVYYHTCGIRRIHNKKTEFKVHSHFSKEFSLYPQDEKNIMKNILTLVQNLVIFAFLD